MAAQITSDQKHEIFLTGLRTILEQTLKKELQATVERELESVVQKALDEFRLSLEANRHAYDLQDVIKVILEDKRTKETT